MFKNGAAAVEKYLHPAVNIFSKFNLQRN